MTKPTKWVCARQRLRSAWASAQSDQSLRCALNGYQRTKGFFMRTSKNLIRLGGCPGWSESSLGAKSFCWFCLEAAHIVLLIPEDIDLNKCSDEIWLSCSWTISSFWWKLQLRTHLLKICTYWFLRKQVLHEGSSECYHVRIEHNWAYRTNPKNSDIRKICGNYPKIWTRRLCHRIMCPKGADGMANRVDPDQIWSGSALFAQAYLSKNLGSLQYKRDVFVKKSMIRRYLNWQLFYAEKM